MGIFDDRANVSGRIAVVIGGAGGIGKAVTMALAGAQVDVAFCDIDSQAVQSTRAEVAALGRRVVAEVVDATVPSALRRFYTTTEGFFGRADIIVNVVGGVLMMPFMEKTPEVCAEDIQRNYGYVLESTRLAVPLLRKSGRGGCIINFTTIEAHRAAGGFAVYAGAKAATTNFSKAMAWELGPERIRVNVVAPDTTASEGNRRALPKPLQTLNESVPPEWWTKAMEMYIPLGVPPSPDDLSNAVLFLASDLAKSVTGQVIHVDGGTAAALGMMRWPLDGGITLPVPCGATLAKLFGPEA
jgi:NAD(P)-dependent dehydrogenase (short-subunit alcohol dehydrogenase family)